MPSRNGHRSGAPHSSPPRRRARADADGNRPAAQVWIVALLDRSVEGIHVDVNDLARSTRGGRFGFSHSRSRAHRTSSWLCSGGYGAREKPLGKPGIQFYDPNASKPSRIALLQQHRLRFPTIAKAIARLPVTSVILDGEAVVEDEVGFRASRHSRPP